MASTTMAGMATCAISSSRPSTSIKVLRAVPTRASRVGRKMGLQVAAAVQYDYDTKVFTKELVKFADTEEYIYR